MVPRSAEPECAGPDWVGNSTLPLGELPPWPGGSALESRVAPAGWGAGWEALGCGVARLARGKLGWRGRSSRLYWQPTKASVQLRIAGWADTRTFKASAFLAGPGADYGWAGRGLSAQGNRSSRSASRGDFPRLLPPTQQFPPLVLEPDQALPAKSSWLYNSALGHTAPAGGTETGAEPRMDKGAFAAAQCPPTDVLPVRQLPERAIEWGGLVQSISEQRPLGLGRSKPAGWWGLQLKVTPRRGRGCLVPSHLPFSWTLPTWVR